MSMKDKPRQDPSNSRRGTRAATATHASYDDEKRMTRHSSKNHPPQAVDRDVKDRTRSMAIIRPHHERGGGGGGERDHRETYSYYQSRPGGSGGGHHASSNNKAMSSEEAQKAIYTLSRHVKETTAFFAAFKDAYQQEVRGIEAYAGQSMLEKLWERKIKYNNGRGGHSSKSRSKHHDGVGLPSAFDEVSIRLQDSLNDAYDGAKSYPTGQNISLARKLDAAIKEIGRLLGSVQFYFQEMDNLIRELKLLKVVLELGGVGTATTDHKTNQRQRTHATGHTNVRESSPDPEDARRGNSREDSGSEDDDQPDEKHNEHLERSDGRGSDDGGDEGGQGAPHGGDWEN